MNSTRVIPRNTTTNVAQRDAELMQEVRCALFATGYPLLQKVDIAAHEGYVVLKGAVATYYEKQLAQEAARPVRGVETLRNEIVVW